MDRHAAAPLLRWGGGSCPVCGGHDCVQSPDVDHLASYPFLPGGRDPMEGQDYVIATDRVHDDEHERFVYKAGDKVPIADAIKYGLIDKPPAKKAAAKVSKRAKKGPAEDRAKRKAEDR